jgi:uncharacterized protein (DUF983 family)
MPVYRSMKSHVTLAQTVCKSCGSTLKVHQLKMIPFYLFFNIVAALFGMTMMHTGDYLKWIIVLIVWASLMMAIYPLVMRLKSNKDEFTKLQ